MIHRNRPRRRKLPKPKTPKEHPYRPEPFIRPATAYEEMKRAEVELEMARIKYANATTPRKCSRLKLPPHDAYAEMQLPELCQALRISKEEVIRRIRYGSLPWPKRDPVLGLALTPLRWSVRELLIWEAWRISKCKAEQRRFVEEQQRFHRFYHGSALWHADQKRRRKPRALNVLPFKRNPK
jgi:hypothetical protein